MYPRPAPPAPAVRRHWIPNGHAGIEWTVRFMRQTAREALHVPEVVEEAGRITYGARDNEEAAELIRDYLAHAVVFTPDPIDTELIRSPAYMLREIEAHGSAPGDCDDVAVLGAALGMAVGIPARYVLVGLTPADPFEHVYTELVLPAGAVELDTTRPAQLPPDVRIYRVSYREA